jgi:hypothetical protein
MFIATLCLFTIIFILTRDSVLTWLSNLSNPFKLMGTAMWHVDEHHTILGDDEAWGEVPADVTLSLDYVLELSLVHAQMDKNAYRQRVARYHAQLALLNDELGATMRDMDETIMWTHVMPIRRRAVAQEGGYTT